MTLLNAVIILAAFFLAVFIERHLPARIHGIIALVAALILLLLAIIQPASRVFWIILFTILAGTGFKKLRVSPKVSK